MAHYRKPLAAAAALNTAIFVVEAVAGFKADSLSLIMDSVHNLSDEMALVFLYLAFVLPHGVSRHLLRTANVFNSVGLLLVSALLLWQAVERILHPAPVVGSVAVVVGLLAAAANRGVARLLLAPSRNNAAIRLAYIHNIGDVYVSLAPVAAGLLVSLTGYSIFDPLIAAGIATWIIVSTVREVFASSEELIWPEKIVCGHSDHEEAAVGAASSRPNRSSDPRRAAHDAHLNVTPYGEMNFGR
jgi:cobalt-zinc-cadmium efflux system protein